MARPPYKFAVLGDPIDHSRSPELHQAMLDISSLEGEYTRIRADHRVLEVEIEHMRQGRWDGLNVTMPLKASAARLADSRSPQAARSNSVNTLITTESGIHGESTDAIALRELVDSGRFDARTSILILGSGAASAAVLSALDDEGPVYVAARRSMSAVDLTGRLGGEVVAWGTAVAGALVVNTTPLGMHGETLPPDVLEVAAGLIDLPYGDEGTPAVQTARRCQIEVADGHEFLLRQAIASFRLWTGRNVSQQELTETLRKG